VIVIELIVLATEATRVLIIKKKLKKNGCSKINGLLGASVFSRKTLTASDNFLRDFGEKENNLQKGKISVFFLTSFSLLFFPSGVQAQSIQPAPDGTQTVVTPADSRFDITGGQTSGDGTNLFHSFTRFNLDPNEIANFIANPAIQNILTRVIGGNPSAINGLIQVTGSNANLFLMNPVGIVFGANARLNVPASFTATTATGIGFGNSWFNATGPNNYAELVGTPSAFAFATSQTPEAIANAGKLAVSKGHNLTLLGGTVVSTGPLEAPGGQILVETVAGGSLLRISQPGHLLNLEIAASDLPITASSLPALLTNGVQSSGSVSNNAVQVGLAEAGVPVEKGDVVVRNVVAQTATLSAENNLNLVESQLRTTGDLNLLAHNTVWVRDTQATSFLAQAGGNLYVQGDRKIDIFALNFPQTAFQSGGNFSLVSNGIISFDAHASSSGSVSMRTLSGGPGNFISLNDPIFTAGTDVSLGHYTGAALKVQAGGSITYEDITITRPADPRTIPNSDTNFDTLTNTPALIMSAGTTIKTGNINTSGQGDAGPVILSAQGDISTGNITSSSRGQGNAGAVTLFTTQGNITTGNIITQAQGNGNSGAVSISSGGNLSTGNIDSTSLSQGNAGVVALSSKGTMSIGNITTQDQGDGNAGAIVLSSEGNLTVNNISTQDQGDGSGAAVSLSTGGNLTLGNIDTSEQGPGDSGAVSLSALGSITNGLINQLEQGPGEQAGLPTITPNLGGILNPPSNDSNTSPNGSGNNTPGSGTTNPPSSVSDPPSGGTTNPPNSGTTDPPSSVSNPPGGSIINPPNSGTTDPSSNGSNPPSSVSNPPGGSIINPPNSGTTDPSSNGSNPPNSGINNPPGGSIINPPNSGTTDPSSNGSNPPNSGINNPPSSNVTNPPNSTTKPSGTTNTDNSTNSTPTNSSSGRATTNPRRSGTTNVPTDSTNSSVGGGNANLPNSGDSSNSSSRGSSSPAPSDSNSRTKPSDNDTTNRSPNDITTSLPSASSPQQLLGENSSSGVAEFNVLSHLEEPFTRQFEQYLGLSAQSTTATLADARDTLQKVEEATGVKPALIYITFVPPQGLAHEARRASSTVETPDSKPQTPQDELELVLVTAQGSPIRVRVAKTTRKQVLKYANKFISQVTNARSGLEYLPPARQLYQWLVAPLEADLEARGIKNLTFIVDTGLRSLPMAALHDGQEFLVEKYSVGLMPSLTLTDTRYRDIRNMQVLAMGAQSFRDHKPLPAVPIELSIITPSLWQGKSFLNDAFTLENLKAQRQGHPFGIIHLATHANFQAGTPNNSYIELWDTKLRLNQLSGLGWNKPPVELLVLSACRTALGNEQAELGFAGFAVQAGVKSAIASLWYVSDEGTLGLMTQLYQQLKRSPIKAEALRQAQIAMLKGQVQFKQGHLVSDNKSIPLPPELVKLGDKDFSHPYFWAGFTIVGSPW